METRLRIVIDVRSVTIAVTIARAKIAVITVAVMAIAVIAAPASTVTPPSARNCSYA